MRSVSKFLLGLFLFLTTAIVTHAQNNILVKGTVVNSSGGIVQGVSVTNKTSKKHLAITNASGAFELYLSPGTILEFTHIQYESLTRAIAAADTLLVVALAESKGKAEQDVVVQGFRSRAKDVQTGSSTVVKGEALQNVPVNNVASLLQGKVAGLNIQNNLSGPGAGPTITLNGSSSISIGSDGFLSPTSPLFIVDGVPIDVNSKYEYGFQSGGAGINPLSLIPPEDIDQMEVLRDAAATSLYGSRAAYGVIIVTTKRGQSKVPIVQYSGNIMYQTPPQMRTTVGGAEERRQRLYTILNYDTAYGEISKELINGNSFLSDSLNAYYSNSTNWQDYVVAPTVSHNHNITVYGGSRSFNYKTNLNYYDDRNIVKNTGFKRYGLSMNGTYMPVEQFKISMFLNGQFGSTQTGSSTGATLGSLADLANLSSLLPQPSKYSDQSAAIANGFIRSENTSKSLLSSLDISYEFLKGLRVSNLFSYSFATGVKDFFTPAFLNQGSTFGYLYNDRDNNLSNRTQLGYNAILGQHNFSLNGFNEINAYSTKAEAIEIVQTPSDQIEGGYGYNSNLTRGGTLNSLKQERIHGYGGYASYNFDKRYVFDASYRIDRTSINGPNQGAQKSPSLAARWNAHYEDFAKNWSDWLSTASVKGSWGQTIKPNGSIFDVFGKYIFGQRFNNDPTYLIDFETIPNVNFLPEENTTTSFSTELSFFKNRITAEYIFMYTTIDNLTLAVDLSYANGFTRLKTVDASLAKRNHLLTLTVRPIDRPGIRWTVSANGSLNKTIMAKLPGEMREYVKSDFNDANQTVPIVMRLGRNQFSNLVYRTEGVYASDADVPINPATGLPKQFGNSSGLYFKAGDPIWTDVNGDYIIDEKDLVPLGNPEPKYYGGISSNLIFHDFTLNVNIQYFINRDVINLASAERFRAYTNPTSMNAMLSIADYDYWKPLQPGDLSTGITNAEYPNPFDFRRANSLGSFRSNQTLFMENGSYWKLGDVTLLYNIPKDLVARYGMSSCRLSLSAYNLLILTKYSGANPEQVSALGRDISNGYPNSKQFSFGINVQF
ncbi:SusC/RagA family TonB-linked outer membrane protein [Niabella sp. CJ426]|uniref:SusC/RagA family TonB-linked outer membrane protein n=1 Tax=Niabella sp. CJ426 TaxID=3393740 RepID=UPI003D0425AB